MRKLLKIIVFSVLVASCSRALQTPSPTVQQTSSVSSQQVLVPSNVLDATALTGTTLARYMASNTLEIGAPEAQNTMTIFTNYQCEYCTHFFKEHYPQIQSDFIESTQLKLQITPKLLEKYDRSVPIAKAFHCAAIQNRGLEYHTELIESGTYQDADLQLIATNLDLNLTTFNACILAEETKISITRQQSVIDRMGVDLIPSFYIGKERIIGLPTYTDLAGFIKLHSTKPNATTDF